MSLRRYPHRVTLATLGDPVPDGYGGYTEGLIPVEPAVWDCAIEPAGSRDMERYMAGAQQTTSTHIVRGRFHPGITASTQITFNGRVLLVQTVRNEHERSIDLTLVCAEVIPGE